jgi:hypothetical protein
LFNTSCSLEVLSAVDEGPDNRLQDRVIKNRSNILMYMLTFIIVFFCYKLKDLGIFDQS